MRPLYVLVYGPEWEDIEYFCDLHIAKKELLRFKKLSNFYEFIQSMETSEISGKYFVTGYWTFDEAKENIIFKKDIFA
jgi:hypothetical protein